MSTLRLYFLGTLDIRYDDQPLPKRSAAGPRWRGRIEHVQSGESAAFLGVDEMLCFVRRVGVMKGEECQPAGKEE
ncbi:MAG: hypothetical protein H8E47_07655 [Anaerolineales bacterium]|nr:hypothetical protein [Anaerolineales bacterium]